MMDIRILNANAWDVVRFTVNGIMLTAIMLAFLEKMYLRRFTSSLPYLFSYVAIVQVSALIACIGNPMLNGICSFILMCPLAIALYKCNKIVCVFHCFCYKLMALFADIASTALISVVGNQTINEALDSQLSMYISSVISWLLLLLSLKILITIFKKEERNVVKLKELTFFVYLTLLEIWITSYVLSLIEEYSSGIILALFMVCFVVLNIYITYLIYKISSISRLKYELALSRQQVDMQLEHYKELIVNQEKSRKIIHDAKNHVLTVESLFANGDKEKCEEYTQILCNKLNELTYDFKCRNTILGIIISSKLQEAEKKKIKLTPIIDNISIDFINDFDITGIFANLLNNSFEECDNLPYELKCINLSVRKINDFLVINVANPTNATHVPEASEKKVYKTTKAGHDGIGLSIVLDIVEKYGGSFIAEVVEGKFIVKITVPI